MKIAYATIKGIETMRTSCKGQVVPFSIQGEKRSVDRASGLGPSALIDAAQMMDRQSATTSR